MIATAFFSFFTDSVLRAPTIGCMLMCLAAGLMGVVIFLRKESLVGEALSHASYPGVILGVIVAAALSISETSELFLSLITIFCAFFTALLGLGFMQFLQKRMRVRSDAALCFVLSTFFGVGITLASEVQFSYTALYRQVITYLYGQAATMTDMHIVIYGILVCVVIFSIFLSYKELQLITFDRQYAKSLGIPVRLIEISLFILVTFSVIIGIRSVGVVLMSAMLIAPAVAARQFTNKLSILFVLAGFFALVSGFFGNYFSVQLTEILGRKWPSARIILPTGPMIVLTASAICLLSILFAPQRGLFVRFSRIAYFRYTCLCENILKAMWRIDAKKNFQFSEIAGYQMTSRFYLQFLLRRMVRAGWIEKEAGNLYRLTADGRQRGEKIVRLHRLWEVYLANYLGVGVERVHRNAEEMEHILTAELEQELDLLLKNPEKDPHLQPIPKASERFYD